jgi:DNA polymerase-4
MRAEIVRLAKRAAASLEQKALVARTVTIKVRYSNFQTVTRSHTEEPATRDAANITERALMLLERTDAGRRAVRLLGVGVHGLASSAPPPSASP